MMFVAVEEHVFLLAKEIFRTTKPVPMFKMSSKGWPSLERIIERINNSYGPVICDSWELFLLSDYYTLLPENTVSQQRQLLYNSSELFEFSYTTCLISGQKI